MNERDMSVLHNDGALWSLESVTGKPQYSMKKRNRERERGRERERKERKKKR
jgi:hypothetical protein